MLANRHGLTHLHNYEHDYNNTAVKYILLTCYHGYYTRNDISRRINFGKQQFLIVVVAILAVVVVCLSGSSNSLLIVVVVVGVILTVL